MNKDAPIYAPIIDDEQGQFVLLPDVFEFSEGVSHVLIEKHGESLRISPAKKVWLTLSESPEADNDFLSERPDIF
ncbi:AbrB family transcriptional regulator [Alkalimonas sp. MEB108]|uniref:AbrB family transcriptional regulator n=1 Tax=Alkalimonas cellulosilytica TaxID=3058395 RepID=A0ABU7J9S8_9GAMM|nr:AbrB family transcriptional regulator [Alkalimonas sp. MEB108]MEE2003261.1 AbrB family transcriptional regulator [Alkalimonas sp. MEB108]